MSARRAAHRDTVIRMFGLIRLPILLLIAFIVGVFFERGNQREACGEIGVWTNGICVTTEIPND